LIIAQIQFLNPGQPIPDEVELRRLLAARQHKVLQALQWLCKHNELYKTKCKISKENAACYHGDVPPALYRSITLVDKGRTRKQKSTYTRADDSDDEADSKRENKRSSEPANDIPLEMRGLVDVNARASNEDLLRAAAVKNSGLQSVLFVPSAKPAKDYHHPELYAGCFPDQFPYGCGVPDDPLRPVPLSLAAFAQRTMYLADDALRTDRVFPFFIFNVVQRHRVHQSAFTSLRLHRFDAFSNLLDTLQPDRLKSALREVQAAEHQKGYATMSDIDDSQLRNQCAKVFKELRTIGGRLPLNDASKLAARREIFGLTMFFGPPDLFVTVNPEDENAALLLHLAGHSVKLELSDPDTPTDVPSSTFRRMVLARDPMAGALYSHSIMNAVISALLGLGNDGEEETGLFGKVAACHFNSEEQNRGSLHWHGLLWLSNKPDPREFAELLESRDFQKRLFSYLDTIIIQQPPAMCTRGPFANPQAASVDPEHFQYPLRKPRIDAHPSLIRPSDPTTFATDAAWYEHIANDLNRLIPIIQTHSRLHTGTCEKPARLRPKLIDEAEIEKQAALLAEQTSRAPVRDCRFHFPRILRDSTGLDADGDIQIERHHHWTNAFGPIFTYCLRCNTDTRTLWGNSSDSLAATFYVTHYISKVSSLLFHLCACLIELPMQLVKHLSSKMEVMNVAQKRTREIEEENRRLADEEAKKAATLDQASILDVPTDSAAEDKADSKKKQTEFSPDSLTTKRFCSTLFNMLQVSLVTVLALSF